MTSGVVEVELLVPSPPTGVVELVSVSVLSEADPPPGTELEVSPPQAAKARADRTNNNEVGFFIVFSFPFLFIFLFRHYRKENIDNPTG